MRRIYTIVLYSFHSFYLDIFLAASRIFFLGVQVFLIQYPPVISHCIKNWHMCSYGDLGWRLCRNSIFVFKSDYFPRLIIQLHRGRLTRWWVQVICSSFQLKTFSRMLILVFNTSLFAILLARFLKLFATTVVFTFQHAPDSYNLNSITESSILLDALPKALSLFNSAFTNLAFCCFSISKLFLLQVSGASYIPTRIKHY